MSRTLLFLIDAWGSLAGGIQTVNRQLCLALAALGKEVGGDAFHIICVARDCGGDEQAEAGRNGVRLLKADQVESDAEDEGVLMMLFHPSLSQLTEVVCVVGHSKFTGKAARIVRDRYFPDAKVVTVYHMDPDETEIFKEGLPESEARSRLERDVASGADVVFAVGPSLARSLQRLLTGRPEGSPAIHTLVCGMREDVPLQMEPPKQPTFLFVGRVEHPGVKGVDLFAKAAGELIRRLQLLWEREPQFEPRFVIRGFPPDQEKAQGIFEAIKAEAERVAQRSVTIVRRTFSPDEDELRTDILGASALVMPSRAEGFGLVALEAISYGVPAIVTKYSGVAEVFQECLAPGTRADYIVDTRDLGPDAVESLVRAFAYFVERPERFQLVGRDLRKKLMKSCSWSAAAKTFLETVIGSAPRVPVQLLADASVEIQSLLKKESRFVNDKCRKACERSIESIFVPRKFQPVRVLQTQEDLQDLDSPVELRPGPGDDNRPWSDVVNSLGTAIILGDPGAGKTILLLREVEQRCLAAVGSLDANAPPDDVKFGLYFHGNQIAEKLASTRGALVDSVVTLVSERYGQISETVESWLRLSFTEGRLLLVVDALDEVSTGVDGVDRRSLLLERMATAGRGSVSCPILLSSRAAGYTRYSIPAASEWCLRPFTSGLVKVAIRKWLATYPDDAERVIVSLAGIPHLSELLTNPLLLMLACQVWEAKLKKGQPVTAVNRRCDLYQQFLDRHLRRRWVERATLKGRAPTGAAKAAFPSFVAMLAWELWRRDPRRFVFRGSEIVILIETIAKPRVLEDRPDLFEDLCDSGIVTKAGLEDREAPYLFLHRTILEFLCAKYLAQTIADPVGAAKGYFDNPDTHTMLWMLVGSLDDPAPLLEALVSWAERQLAMPGESTAASESPLIAELLADCLFECRGGTIASSTRQQSWELITRGIDRRQRSRRRHGGEWSDLEDWSLVYRAVRAADVHQGPASRARDVLRLLEQIRHAKQERGRVLPANAVTGAQQTIDIGLRSNCSLVRWGAIWCGMALIKKGMPEVGPTLRPRLEQVLHEDNSAHVRCIGARALAEVSSTDAIGLLRSALDGPNQFVAVGAAIGLGRLASDEAVMILKNKARGLLDRGEKQSGTRDPLLNALIGALEDAVGRATKTGKVSLILGDAPLVEIFLKALSHLLPSVRSSAASALGKMRWQAAWSKLRAMVEDPGDRAVDTQRMRACACYACDQLTQVIDDTQFGEAEDMFRGRVSDRNEAPQVRRWAASGIVRLIGRGHRRSAGLINMMLLQAAQDPNSMVATSCLVALVQLPPEDVLDDLILILDSEAFAYDKTRRQLVGLAVQRQPTKTGFSVASRLLIHESDPDVLTSALGAVGSIYEKAREGQVDLGEDVNDVDLLEELAGRSIDLLSHERPTVVASSLLLVQELFQLQPFRRGGPLLQYREAMLARVRGLLEHENPGVLARACGAIGLLGTAEDLPRLESLRDHVVSRKVRDSARGACDLITSRE